MPTYLIEFLNSITLSKNMTDEFNNKLIVKLTIEGTEHEEVEVEVSNPHKTIREQVESIVRVFGLPTHTPYGLPYQYLLGQILGNGEEPVILDFEDEEGQPQTLLDNNIKSGAHLYLTQPPLYGCFPPITQLYLSIENTSYKNIEVSLVDIDKPIREHINRFLDMFHLPQTDKDGNEIQYTLVRKIAGRYLPQILDLMDEDGNDLTFKDYNLKAKEHLSLMQCSVMEARKKLSKLRFKHILYACWL